MSKQLQYWQSWISFPRLEEKFCDPRHSRLCLQRLDRQLIALGKTNLVQQLCEPLTKENWSKWDLLKEIPMGTFRKIGPSEAQLADCTLSSTSAVKYLHGSRKCHLFTSCFFKLIGKIAGPSLSVHLFPHIHKTLLSHSRELLYQNPSLCSWHLVGSATHLKLSQLLPEV